MQKNKLAAKKQRARKPKAEVKQKQEQRKAAVARRNGKLVVLVPKPPKDAVASGQGLVVLTVLDEQGGKLTVDELLKQLEGRLVSRNALGLKDVLHMVLPVLRKRGLIQVKEA